MKKEHASDCEYCLEEQEYELSNEMILNINKKLNRDFTVVLSGLIILMDVGGDAEWCEGYIGDPEIATQDVSDFEVTEVLVEIYDETKQEILDNLSKNNMTLSEEEFAALVSAIEGQIWADENIWDNILECCREQKANAYPNE